MTVNLKHIFTIAFILAFLLPSAYAFRSSSYGYVAQNSVVSASNGDYIYPDSLTIDQMRQAYQSGGLKQINVTCTYNCKNFDNQFSTASGYIYSSPYYNRDNIYAGNYVSFPTNSRQYVSGITSNTAGVVQYNGNPWKFYRDYTVRTVPTQNGYEVQINGRPWWERAGIATENTVRSLWYRVTGRDLSQVNPYGQ